MFGSLCFLADVALILHLSWFPPPAMGTVKVPVSVKEDQEPLTVVPPSARDPPRVDGLPSDDAPPPPGPMGSQLGVSCGSGKVDVCMPPADLYATACEGGSTSQPSQLVGDQLSQELEEVFTFGTPPV